NLSGDRTREIHTRLGRALEATDRATPEAQVFHFQEAGDRERAGLHATSAALRAAEALAFERAAELYRLAISCLSEREVAARRLRVALGDALANAGLCGEAADEYQRAAATASAVTAVDLRRRAAEQRLRAGDIDTGLDALRAVLDEVGLRMSSSPQRALASLLSRRATLRVRGYRFKERDASQLSPEDLTRIDVCWSAATSLSMIDAIHGADFQARHLSLALRAGEPYRAARALAMEAMESATGGTPALPRTLQYVTMVKDIAARIDNPHASALAIMAEAWAEYHAGNYRAAHSRLERARTELRERCTGVVFELAAVERMLADTLYQLGDIIALRSHVRASLRESERRGDRYSGTA
ncbi:MAG: ATP-binding protein, partial [Myxococcota bacterium]